MDRFPRTTLRTWAVLDGIYGAIVVGLAVWAVPWKTTAANLLLIAYGIAVALGAPGLWRGARWCWRLGVITSLIGLGAGVLAVAGLVASWAYLRGAYGAFGAGASIASLLIAGMVFQLLGLYPAIRLRALLRREVRAAVAVGRSRAGAAALILALLPFGFGLVVDRLVRLDPRPPVPEAALSPALAVVRARAEGREPPRAPALRGVDPGEGPLYVTLWHEGERMARAAGRGRDLGEAADSAGQALRAALQASGRPALGQIRLDRIVARGRVARRPRLVFSLALDPGLDGLSSRDERLVFLPDDVLQAGVAGSAAPLREVEELRAGIDVDWMEARLSEAGVTGPLERIRTESWIEHDGGAVRLYRGNALPSAGFSARAAALTAGDFILDQMQSDGRFRYRYHPYLGRGAVVAGAADYSVPRHAGTAYGLTLLFASTQEARFRDGAAAALQWLAREVNPTCGAAHPTGSRACLIQDGRAFLGPAALSAVAFLTYQSWTQDRRYAALAGQLLGFLLSMQRPDGELHHSFDTGTGQVMADPPRMFASEQAALALVMGHRELGDPRFLPAAERLLDHLTLRKHDHFLGRFSYGADHWTCLAAEAALGPLPRRHYFDFCLGYARFMQRLQYPAYARSPARDFAGHYGFGYFLVPQAPATAGFAEALLATVALGQHHRAEMGELRNQARAALQALARDQLRPENSYLALSPGQARGGIRRSLVEPEIRIDFVQHAASAFARASALGLDDLMI